MASERHQRRMRPQDRLRVMTGHVMTGCALEWRAAAMREYRSKQMWRGVPIIHVASGFGQSGGFEPATARGVIAVGDIAQGVIAVGLVAVGVVALGPMSLGIVAVGLVTLGLAIGVGLVAIGAIAVGFVAIGLVAFGLVAIGWLKAVGLVTLIPH